jgi:DNA-binding beta-propeller fold protein YncE
MGSELKFWSAASALVWLSAAHGQQAAQPSPEPARGAVEPARAALEPPHYAVDASWPKTLPNDWILGQVAGIAVDGEDHIWIIQRPKSVTEDEAAAVQNPPTAECCAPAPSVIEFDRDGRVLQGWGGPVWNRRTSSWETPPGDWPASEHGIYVDGEGYVWIAGNAESDGIVLKLRGDGTHVLTIGRPGQTGGSNDTMHLNRPADIAVDTAAHEVYVADGYGNRRVIVFDSETGAYKRHWGAYGERPEDGPVPAYAPGAGPARQFRGGTPGNGAVHAVVLSHDGLVYVADRQSDRIQAFRPGGEFVLEKLVAPGTLDIGSVWDLAIDPSPGEPWLLVADGANKKIWVLDRASLETVGSFGRGGRQAGEFNWVHNLAIDSAGNVYTAEVNTGKRVQKFTRIEE